MRICRKLNNFKEKNGYFMCELDNAYMGIWFVTESIIRIKVSFTDEESFTKPEASYVLKTTAWEDELDFLFEGERNHVKALIPEVIMDEDSVTLKTGSNILTIVKNPLEITIRDKAGHILYRTLSENPYTLDSNNRITCYSRMEENDIFYGFGEKTGPLNKNKEYIRMRATDSYAYDPQRCATMYKHIPFYICLKPDTGIATGFFYNNFNESVFDLGKEKSNYWPRYSYFRADGGDLDLFIFTGPSIKKITDDYTLLTGRPMLFPKRALGYQGSSMYYAELPEASDKAILNFIDAVHRNGFPIDGFHLSSGYTSTDEGKRCVFTWNSKRFPDPAVFMQQMNLRNAQAVANVKPGVLLSHPDFGKFKDRNVFVKDSEDEMLPAVFPWWGGPGAFFDFTNPLAREVWKKKLTESLIELGTNSIWNDNCEYDSILDGDAICDYDGKKGRISALKPIMSTLMSKLSYDAVIQHNENARPYIVCRSGSSGIQSYAQNWIGDNYTSWESLKHNIPTMLGMSLSGQPNIGSDIGGFAGPVPSEELFVRWVQHGIFQPRFSIHSASDDNTVTQPWMYRGATDLIRRAMLLRYSMTPYLYSLEYEAHKTGSPIMRPLVYEFQNDPATYEENYEFMLGAGLLIAGVLKEGATKKRVYLPKGCKWYEIENNYKAHDGGSAFDVDVTLSSIPRFVREGTIIPFALNRISSMEKDPVNYLRLLITPYENAEGKEFSFVYYDDDGVTNDYKKGIYKKTTITARSGKIVEVSFRSEGSYTDTVEKVQVTMISKSKCPFLVSLDGEMLTHILDRDVYDKSDNCWYYSMTKKAVYIKYPNPKKDCSLKVSFEDFDLIGM